MATSFSGGRSRSTQREPSTMGKQLVNFITCGYNLYIQFYEPMDFIMYIKSHEPMDFIGYIQSHEPMDFILYILSH